MEQDNLQVSCVGNYEEYKEFCKKICRSTELCYKLNKLRKEGELMFDIKKIRVTKIEEFASATDAMKAAEEAQGAAGSEIRAITDRGDLQLTLEDLKKIQEDEVKASTEGQE